MKRVNLIVLLPLLVTSLSCESLDDLFDSEEPACPVANGEAIPSAVVEAFNNLYAGTTDLMWCEASGDYIAAFNGQDGEKYAMFDAEGNLLVEGNDDAIEDKAGCECELNGGDDDD